MMNPKKHVSLLGSLLLCASLIAGPGVGKPSAAKKSSRAEVAPRPVEAVTPAPTPEAPSGARIVLYGDKDVVRVKTKLRYTTLLILPKNEQILDFTCGDKDLWVVNGAQNLAYVKPAKAGAETNLNLVAASGNIFSFVLVEVSETPAAAPDLKVFVELKDDSMVSAATGAPRFVSVQQIDAYRQEAEKAKEETRQAKEAAQAAIDVGISKFMANVRFPYRFEAGKKPFWVRSMYHDDKFMYIQARPEEAPALYEMRDGKPNLVNFDYRNGAYVVDRILDEGYLVIGKQKLSFKRQD